MSSETEPTNDSTANGKVIAVTLPRDGDKQPQYIIQIDNLQVRFGLVDLHIAQKLAGSLSEALKNQRQRVNPIVDTLKQIKESPGISQQDREFLLRAAMETAQKTWSVHPTPQELEGFMVTTEGNFAMWKFYVRYWNRKLTDTEVAQFLEDWDHSSRETVQKWMQQNLKPVV